MSTQVFEPSRVRLLPVPGALQGDPVMVGSLAGVAVTDAGGASRPAGYALVALEGPFTLVVDGPEQNAGNLVYMASDGSLTSDGTDALPFGAALEAKADGAQAITVEVGGGTPAAASGSSVISYLLPVPDDTPSGSPVMVGDMPGVTLTAEAGGFATVALSGIYPVPVGFNSPQSAGWLVYVDGDGLLSDGNSGGTYNHFGSILQDAIAGLHTVDVLIGGGAGNAVSPA